MLTGNSRFSKKTQETSEFCRTHLSHSACAFCFFPKRSKVWHVQEPCECADDTLLRVNVQTEARCCSASMPLSDVACGPKLIGATGSCAPCRDFHSDKWRCCTSHQWQELLCCIRHHCSLCGTCLDCGGHISKASTCEMFQHSLLSISLLLRRSTSACASSSECCVKLRRVNKKVIAC